MKKVIIPIALIVIIGSLLTYFLKNNSNKILSEYDLLGLSVTEMVDSLEAQTIDRDEMVASISATELTISTEDSVLKYSIPDDLFYLSFAPYITKTHPCGTHNLVTCRGELKNQSFDILIVDQIGNVLVDDTLISHDNGFVGVWLPRDIQGTIYITYGQWSVTKSIQTFDDSFTCLTDLLLVQS
ncbi:MAG: hypothetical protein CVV56_01670 [Tenericutes bacterium HGW-Tenericutes-1]|jgi:hypothetical protein|nr:MAG: hypothetical protein CVV56_01670 [Tenericutes bacterium HGW-Tenericutes-1]